MTKPLILDDTDIQDLAISPMEMVDAIEATLQDKIAGRFLTTPKSVITPGDGRYMMTTLSTGPELTVVKVVTVCPDNPSKGLPSITGSISVLDSRTGKALAVMDAEWITGIRTAALSALSAKFLAKSDSASIGFLGCGVQARAHLDVLSAYFPIQNIVAFGRGEANIGRLCRNAESKGITARHSTNADDALACDIIVSSLPITFDAPPFLDARNVRPQALAIITDAAKPWIPEHLRTFGTIVTDDLEQERNMAQPMVPPAILTGDLAGLIGGLKPNPTGSRAFMFRGIAAGDYAAAALVYRRVTNITNS